MASGCGVHPAMLSDAQGRACTQAGRGEFWWGIRRLLGGGDICTGPYRIYETGISLPVAVTTVSKRNNCRGGWLILSHGFSPRQSWLSGSACDGGRVWWRPLLSLQIRKQPGRPTQMESSKIHSQ